MTLAATTSVLGLSAAAIWGAADFSGGMAARHLRVFWLLAISHAFSLVCLLLFAGVLHQARPDAHILAMGLWSGIAGGIALLTFYHALSLGEMGITAAISGLLTAALPVVFTLITIGSPSRRQLAGFALAALAIWLISSPPNTRKEAAHDERKRLALAVVSGLGFGAFLIFLRQANGGGLLWPLAASRVGSLALALGGGLLFSRHRFTVEATTGTTSPDRRVQWKIGVALAVLAGTCDTSGNFLFIAATRIGRLDIAAVLASLYPASTILLAAWLLKERTSPRQAVGMTAALVAVALIS
jgi:drug/metabolite transporter (DMT)-like permease